MIRNFVIGLEYHCLDMNLFFQVDLVLQSVLVDEDDPGLLIDWNMCALGLFVNSANMMGAGQAQPPWITTAPGAMTCDSLADNIAAFLAATGGGRRGKVLIAPNTLPQMCSVMKYVAEVEWNPFIQACLGAMIAYQPLAQLSTIADRRTVLSALPIQMSILPAGFRNFFS